MSLLFQNRRNRPTGEFIYTEIGSDRRVVIPTQQCVHCGRVFACKPPKKIIRHIFDGWTAQFMEAQGKTVRGWCWRCNGPVCSAGCLKCVPEEQLLENYEQHRPLDYTPIRG